MTTNTKLTRKDLQNLLGGCYKTACKEYNIIRDSLQLKRKYLTANDLKKYGI